jgi:hypothetical protein
MLGNKMLTVRHGAFVDESKLGVPVRFEDIEQFLPTRHAFALICVRWSWIGLHTLACEISQPTA